MTNGTARAARSTFVWLDANGLCGIFERAVSGDAERPVYRSATPVGNMTLFEFSPNRKWLAFQILDGRRQRDYQADPHC